MAPHYLISVPGDRYSFGRELSVTQPETKDREQFVPQRTACESVTFVILERRQNPPILQHDTHQERCSFRL